MYGSRFGTEGFDTCTPSSALAAGDTDSYVYRIDTKTLAVDQVIQVGLVPKYVATMLRASDLAVLQSVATGVNPVGVTFDRDHWRRVGRCLPR